MIEVHEISKGILAPVREGTNANVLGQARFTDFQPTTYWWYVKCLDGSWTLYEPEQDKLFSTHFLDSKFTIADCLEVHPEDISLIPARAFAVGLYKGPSDIFEGIQRHLKFCAKNGEMTADEFVEHVKQITEMVDSVVKAKQEQAQTHDSGSNNKKAQALQKGLSLLEAYKGPHSEQEC